MFEIDRYSATLKRRIQRLVGNRIELVWSKGSELDPVSGEPEWIEQSILEIALRARSAMPYGGRLIIEGCNLDLDEFSAAAVALTAGRYVMLEMTCSRPSLAAVVEHDDLPYLLDYTDDLSFESTSDSMNILQSLGGTICEYNEPGRALTVRVFLPSAATLVYSDEEVINLPAPSDPETILLVEDESYVRDVACEILESAGYHVISASTGKEALAAFEKHGAVNLLLTDVVMPGMNGHTLSNQLTALQPGLKTIYMSGYTESSLLRHDLEVDNILYVQKPFTLESLTNKVKEVLASPAS